MVINFEKAGVGKDGTVFAFFSLSFHFNDSNLLTASSVPSPALSTLHIFSQLILPTVQGNTIIPTSQMRRLRLKEVENPVGNHPTAEPDLSRVVHLALHSVATLVPFWFSPHTYLEHVLLL